MKIALVLYGQPRCVHKKDVYLSHKNLICDKYNTDVYMHCWHNYKDGLCDSTFDINDTFTFCPINSPELLMERYRPKKVLFEYPKIFELTDIIKEKCEKYYSDLKYERILTNLLSHIYSIEQSIKLIDTPEEYDFIILSRYDFILHNMPDLRTLDTSKFYVSNEHERFPNVYYIFGPKYIQSQYMFSNFSNIIEYFSNPEYMPDLNVEYIKFTQYLLNYSPKDILAIPILYERIKYEINSSPPAYLKI